MKNLRLRTGWPARGLALALVVLTASATALLAAPTARAAHVPAHTLPEYRGWVRNAAYDWYFTDCIVQFGHPRVWGVTANPNTEVVAYQLVAWSSATGYFGSAVHAAYASQTAGNPPLWYAQSHYDGSLHVAEHNSITLPRGRTYWIGFQIKSAGQWVWPSDGWLRQFTCS